MSVHVACDGAVLSPKGTGSVAGGSEEVHLISVLDRQFATIDYDPHNRYANCSTFILLVLSFHTHTYIHTYTHTH